ncbi:MarR family winged helix-turn-helix transcriptional regulator [Camelimonas abortus]|uniref:MarR family winged helix-turn-helix transcriptional regulator n=1 Tax=Camelimonas abortus TaxID=1017184 RepID=A0ABV7LDL6_9HYPH
MSRRVKQQPEQTDAAAARTAPARARNRPQTAPDSAGSGDDGASARAPGSPGLTVSRPQLLVDGSDLAFRAMIHDTLAFSARIQEVRARLGALLNLSGSQYTILVALSHLQGADGIGVNTLAGHLHLSGAFVTIEVNRLVERGFVRKVTNPEDRRRVLLTVTPLARAELEAITSVQRPANDALFADISRADFHRLRRLLPVLVENADRALKLLDYLTPQGVLPQDSPAPKRRARRPSARSGAAPQE